MAYSAIILATTEVLPEPPIPGIKIVLDKVGSSIPAFDAKLEIAFYINLGLFTIAIPNLAIWN
mgnify:FL=1